MRTLLGTPLSRRLLTIVEQHRNARINAFVVVFVVIEFIVNLRLVCQFKFHFRRSSSSLLLF
jgi:hypothetical protein